MLDTRGDVLYVGKARSAEGPRRQLYAGQTAHQPAAAHGQPDAARWRSSPPIPKPRRCCWRRSSSSASARRSTCCCATTRAFPSSCCATEQRFPAHHEASRRAAGEGQLLRPVRQRGIGQHHHQRAAKTVPAAQSAPTASSAAATGPACSTRSSGAARPASAGSTRRATTRWCKQAKDFLGGKSGAVQADLETQMAKAAEDLDFETAAILRDRLRAATFIQGSQAINASGVGDADVFALAAKGGQIGIQAFFIRGGQNWGHRAFFPARTQGSRRSAGAGRRAGAVLRRSAAAAHHSGRSRTARTGAADRSVRRAGGTTRSRSASRSAATGAG